MTRKYFLLGGLLTVAIAAVIATSYQPASAEKKADGKGDWPMWGGTPSRNMVNHAAGIKIDFEPAAKPEAGKKILWTAQLGSQTYGNPVVASGKVFVGTNNGAEYRPKHVRKGKDSGDRGCVLCFDEKTGEFLWQLTRKKLAAGRVNDWPEQGICSTPCVEGDRLWVATNRCELMCIDVNGFHDGKNDGLQNEEDQEKQDADIIWSLDMINDLGVFPHNLATSSPLIHGDLILLVTSNGVDEAHLEIPAPRAPSFIAIHKNTGKVIWDDPSPSLDSESPEPYNTILHGQWGSPALGVVNGQAQVYMPGGDGWLYAMDPKTGEHIWKFDLNPKDSKWELGGRGTRNAIISTPVFHDNSVILAVGQDPEHGEGVGHLYRIDATKKGDVSPVTVDGRKNPNSGQIWHLGGVDKESGEYLFRRTISTASVYNGLVFVPDLTGYLHCVDFKTGERYWEHDTLAAVWGSPLSVDGKVFLGDEDGEMIILAADKAGDKVLAEKVFPSSIYSTPTIANGVIFVSDRSRLYAFKAN